MRPSHDPIHTRLVIADDRPRARRAGSVTALAARGQFDVAPPEILLLILGAPVPCDRY